MADSRRLAATPPMGWNSWDSFGFNIDEADFKSNASVLAQLSRYGWKYAVIDEGWYMNDPSGATARERDYQLDDHGRLVPAVRRFPSAAGSQGFRPLADWTHRRGLRIGIHIVRGIPKSALQSNPQILASAFHVADAIDVDDTCPWDDGNYGVRDNPAGQSYYDALFRMYAAWGIDFIKVDCIANNPYRATEIRQIAAAIHRAGRPMALSLSPGPTDISHADQVEQQSQMWRISNDVWDGWSFEHTAASGDFPAGLGSAFDRLALWNGHGRPGHWPDADMLPLGALKPRPGWGEPRDSRLTPDEQQTLFALWAIARSPLFFGGNLTLLDSHTRSLLTNKRLIDINQGAWITSPARRPAVGSEDVRTWIARPEDARRTDRVLALFNVGDRAVTIRASWSELGVTPSPTQASDVMANEAFVQRDGIDVHLAPHASAIYSLH